MNLSLVSISTTVLILSGVCAAEDSSTSFQSRVFPVLQAHCTKCHGTEKQKAKLSFAGPHGAEQLAAGRDLWFRVAERIEAGEMPPEDEKPLSPAERQAVVAWVRGDFIGLLAAKQ